MNRSRRAPAPTHLVERSFDVDRRRSTACRRLSRLIVAAVLLARTSTALASGGNSNLTTAVAQPAVVTLNTAIGSTSSVTVSLFDNSSPPLTISTITLSGTNAGEFRLGGTCGAGVVVNRSVGPCSIVVTFAPGALGSRTATIAATFGNAPAISVPLNGQGIAPTPTNPVIHVDNIPPSGTVDFGSRSINFEQVTPSALADIFFLISDTGGAVLMTSESVIGPNSGDFLIQGVGTKGAHCFNGILLNSAQSPCQLPLMFIPTAVGPRTATLRIITNDPGRPTIDIPLSGIGTPALAVPPPPPPMGFNDITGLWGVATEPGWLLSIYHHALAILGPPATDAVLALWETYDTTGQPVWFELKDGHWTDAFTYTGNVHRFTGSPFTGPFVQSQVVDTIVGTATLSFTDGNTGTLSFSINGFTGSKPITRNPFTF